MSGFLTPDGYVDPFLYFLVLLNADKTSCKFAFSFSNLNIPSVFARWMPLCQGFHLHTIRLLRQLKLQIKQLVFSQRYGIIEQTPDCHALFFLGCVLAIIKRSGRCQTLKAMFSYDLVSTEVRDDFALFSHAFCYMAP